MRKISFVSRALVTRFSKTPLTLVKAIIPVHLVVQELSIFQYLNFKKKIRYKLAEIYKIPNLEKPPNVLES